MKLKDEVNKTDKEGCVRLIWSIRNFGIKSDLHAEPVLRDFSCQFKWWNCMASSLHHKIWCRGYKREKPSGITALNWKELKCFFERITYPKSDKSVWHAVAFLEW